VLTGVGTAPAALASPARILCGCSPLLRLAPRVVHSSPSAMAALAHWRAFVRLPTTFILLRDMGTAATGCSCLGWLRAQPSALLAWAGGELLLPILG